VGVLSYASNHDQSPLVNEFDPRKVLKASASALLAIALIRLIGIRFGFPEPILIVLVLVALVLIYIVGVCVTRIVNKSHAHRHRLNPPLMSGRFRGTMTVAALCLVLFVSGRLVLPRSWPTNIDSAVATLEATLDADATQRLAELGPYDLRLLHPTLGSWVGEHFGLAHGNYRLHFDCGFGDYIDPDSCTSLIIETLWKKLRGEMPQQQRAALELLESRMEAVILPPLDFRNTPLDEVARYFNRNISHRLTDASMFEVIVAPADTSVAVTWKETRAVSLADAIMRLGAETEVSVRKVPPNLRLERDASESFRIE